MACILSCGTHTNDYYAGIVVDELGIPIKNVTIKQNLYDQYAISTMVWHQHGETTEFSPIITSDSSKIVLQSSKLNKDIVFTTIETGSIPDYDSTKSRFSKKRLEGIWLKNGTENLNGFKFNKDDLYVYGLSGNRHIRYTIIKDKITLYKTFFYGRVTKIKKVTGTILEITNTELTIKWSKNNSITYKKFKENL